LYNIGKLQTAVNYCQSASMLAQTVFSWHLLYEVYFIHVVDTVE